MSHKKLQPYVDGFDYSIENKSAIITHTITEQTHKGDPFFLQNLLYDLPFDVVDLQTLTLRIIVPRNMPAYIVDDLHFKRIKSSHRLIKSTRRRIKKSCLELILHESSQVTYRLFVANHHLCETCPKKEDSCQTIPPTFEKSIKISLIEPHAQAYVKCHYLGDKSSEFNLKTVQHHSASNTTSKLIVKGILDDQAKLVSDNTTIVDKSLTDVVSEQANKNMLLCGKARVISVPKLKTESPNVSCKHSATVTSINKDQLFYLQSRGINKIEAERLLIEAFLN